METPYSGRVTAVTGFLVSLLFAILIFSGCSSKDSPLGDAALSFKKEAIDTIDNITPLLVDPLENSKMKDVEKIVQDAFSESSDKSASQNFRLIVLDKNGVEVALGGGNLPDEHFNFSNYRIVNEALKKRKRAHARLYRQDGEKIIVIGSPVLSGKGVVGVLVIGLTMKEVKENWGVSEEEFLSIDFNR